MTMIINGTNGLTFPDSTTQATAAGSGGAVLQVLSVTKTDTFSTNSFYGLTWDDVTGLSISITPSNVTSKILIIANLTIGTLDTAALNYRFVRGSTVICVGNADGVKPPVTGGFFAGDAAGIASLASTSSMYLDSPATTSSTTYKVQAASSTVNLAYINRTGSDRNSFAYDPRATSTLTIMEIAV